jgi:hypothetical protein
LFFRPDQSAAFQQANGFPDALSVDVPRKQIVDVGRTETLRFGFPQFGQQIVGDLIPQGLSLAATSDKSACQAVLHPYPSRRLPNVDSRYQKVTGQGGSGFRYSTAKSMPGAVSS